MPMFKHGGAGSLSSALAELAEAIRRSSTCEVHFDRGERAVYSTDSSNFRHLPLGVVVPKTTQDVLATLRECDRSGVPVLSRGTGTSLAGQTTNVAVIIDHSKYLNHILEIDRQRRTARIQMGVVLDDLRNEAEEQFGLTFGPDPSTHEYCTLRGMLGNNACGIHSLQTGRTVDNVERMTVALYDGTVLDVGPTSEEDLTRLTSEPGAVGELYRELTALRDEHAEHIRHGYADIPRRVSGYNLEYLLPEHGFNVARALVGTEGTCAVFLEATLQLTPAPRAKAMLVVGYQDIFTAADDLPRLRGYGPIAIEGLDEHLVEFMLRKHIHASDIELFPRGAGWLVVEFAGETQDEADGIAKRVARDIDTGPGSPSVAFVPVDKQHRVWAVREAGLSATAHVPAEPEAWPGWEDSAVAPEKLGDYLRALHELYRQHGFRASMYGHFGQGLVHTRIPFDLRTARGVADYKRFLYQAAEKVVEFGGNVTGEHGDGQQRGALLPLEYDATMMELFRRFKVAWDPHNRLNPQRLIDPDPVDAGLRLGPDYNPEPVTTHFAYPRDGGSFAEATLRCVGVGKCRNLASGIMCPSYMVTREEKHSTRGRARILFEMLNGELRDELWRSDEVHEALDLCLSCKGCKQECPVQVDMATYKAEFLAHYYKGRLRPRHAYAMGWIHRWARLGSLAPGLANLATQSHGLQRMTARLAGLTAERPLPPFAKTHLRKWFKQRQEHSADVGDRSGPRVILWPDTFNSYFTPGPAQATVKVLEHAGYRVELPRRRLCCGRALYDYGMLDLAKSLLRQIIDTLRPEIRAGIPIIGVEPSCIAVFRDELLELFPHDQDALRLSQSVMTLSEFLSSANWKPPRIDRPAIVHGHCHHKSIMGVAPDLKLMQQAGLEPELLDSGCCGLAGSFGYEAGHHEVSMGCAERVLAPRVRAAGDRIIIADGFSCRSQIEFTTGCRPRHLSEVLADALD